MIPPIGKISIFVPGRMNGGLLRGWDERVPMRKDASPVLSRLALSDEADRETSGRSASCSDVLAVLAYVNSRLEWRLTGSLACS